MTVGRKLLGGFGVMLGLVLLLSAAALVALRNLNDDLDRAAKVTARKQYLAGGVNAGASEMASLARGSVLAWSWATRRTQTHIRSSSGRRRTDCRARSPNCGNSPRMGAVTRCCSEWNNRHRWCGRRNRSCGRQWPTSNWIRRW